MSRETCWMRCAMPQPCMGSSARVFRIRRSSVPCRISTPGLTAAPLDGLQVEYRIALVDCQGEAAAGDARCGYWRGVLRAPGRCLHDVTWHTPTMRRCGTRTINTTGWKNWPRAQGMKPGKV